jgi:hypothetical protein
VTRIRLAVLLVMLAAVAAALVDLVVFATPTGLWAIYFAAVLLYADHEAHDAWSRDSA